MSDSIYIKKNREAILMETPTRGAPSEAEEGGSAEPSEELAHLTQPATKKIPTRTLARSEDGKSESEGLKVRTYKITISPKGDVSDECLAKIKKQCEKHLYAYAVVERGTSGQRHCHIALCGHKEKQLKHWKEPWSELVMKCHKDSIKHIACKANVMYDNKWYEEYLNKEEDREIIYDRYNPENIAAYFPSQEVQDKLQAISTHNRTSDKHMADHEARWIEHNGDDSSYESACEYLLYRMNVKRDMQVMIDHRRLCQLAYALYMYRNKITTPNAEMINHGSRMSGNYVPK